MEESKLQVLTSQKSTGRIEAEQIREFLNFFLSAFRCRIAVQKKGGTPSSQSYPFDFNLFLNDFKKLLLEPSNPSAVTTSLNYIVDQGLLDSLLPYLRATLRLRSVRPQNQPVLPSSPHFQLPPSKINELQLQGLLPPKKFGKTKEEAEIIIHVCEEGKGIWQDFKCAQNVLTKGMGYFARVGAKGQSLQDMDISVHCEIKIFDWLLQWIASTNHKEKITEISKWIRWYLCNICMR